MPVTWHPPHRSQRALLMHWAPASSIDAHAFQRLPYPIQLIWQKYPALCLVPVLLGWIPFSQPPFLHLFRHRLVVTCFVQRFPRYYGTVRLPAFVRHCFTPLGFSMRTLHNLIRPNTGSPDSRSNNFRACMRSPTPPSSYNPHHIGS